MKKRGKKNEFVVIILTGIILVTLFIAFKFTGYSTNSTGNQTLPENQSTNQTFDCTDSDGGINFYVKGTVESSGASATDFCYDESGLSENYCLEGYIIAGTTHNCPYGCLDGACITNATLNQTQNQTTEQINNQTNNQTNIGNQTTNQNGSINNQTNATLNQTQNQTSSSSDYNVSNPNIASSLNNTCTLGCIYDEDKCLPYGYRVGTKYCSLDNFLIEQISEGICENNFECVSNICADSQCISPGLWQKFVNWFLKIFGK